MLLLALAAVGLGCQEAKPPPSPKTVAFSQEVQSVINRIAPPMTGPVAQKNREAVQEALVKAFSVCAEACQGMTYNVFILDQHGALIAVYPPVEMKSLEFSDYKAVTKASRKKSPTRRSCTSRMGLSTI